MVCGEGERCLPPALETALDLASCMRKMMVSGEGERCLPPALETALNLASCMRKHPPAPPSSLQQAPVVAQPVSRGLSAACRCAPGRSGDPPDSPEGHPPHQACGLAHSGARGAVCLARVSARPSRAGEPPRPCLSRCVPSLPGYVAALPQLSPRNTCVRSVLEARQQLACTPC